MRRLIPFSFVLLCGCGLFDSGEETDGKVENTLQPRQNLMAGPTIHRSVMVATLGAEIPTTGRMQISGIVDYEILDIPDPPPPGCVPTPGQETRETSCSDGVDNDCDGLIDAADPDCVIVPPPCVPTPGQERKETSCTDTIDNDCDGLVDAADPDCAVIPPPGDETLCGQDGVDNSCPPQLLQSLVDAAAAGDVIRIAAGLHNWQNNGAEGVVIDRNITITGGGQCDNCGQIPDQLATPEREGRWPAVIDIGSPQHQLGENDFLIRVPQGASGGIARITGLAFQGFTKFNYNWFGDTPGAFIHVSSGNHSEYRIDNNYFHDFNSPDGGYDCGVMQTHCYWAYGVVDSNYIETDTNSGHVISIYRLAQTGNYGGESMMEKAKYGSDEFVFFEDNTVFSHCGGSDITDAPFGAPGGDMFNGGRAVFRHNFFRNGNVTVHDTSGGMPSRAGHAQEIYSNTFTWHPCAPDWTYANAITWRGGSMVVWENQINNYQYPVNIYDTRAGGSTQGWGTCNPSNAWDNRGPPGGYNCVDAPGYIQSPGPTPGQAQPQTLTPGRFWLNVGSNIGSCFTPENGGFICNKSQGYVHDGVEYIFSADDSAKLPGYIPYVYPHPLRS